MRFSLLTLGKPKYPFWQAAQDHYAKAIQPMASLDILELRDQAGDPEKEYAVLKAAWEKRCQTGSTRLVVLDETGKNFTSVNFAAELGKWRDQGVRETGFIVGGPYGTTPALKKEAQLLMSLGPMTLPHDLARVVFLEQLYRALHIQAGTKYHHV